MKYVALLSGGKDSCFNLVHCKSNGHELVAAASLRPAHGTEELDSYLYQTVGQDAIETVAQALEVPLYRGFITGSAIEQGSEYGGRENRSSGGHPGDETEDLHALLSLVKQKHPDVEGVSVGAILSNYQRVRVEHVCQRHSLVPLCYLWQREQEELLAEMIDAGMEAILIKVAGIGLAEKHLGKSLREMQPTLKRLNDLYGSHICGEGGEYETLTLDCPIFKRRIRLNETEVVIHSDNDFATVAYLRIKDASLEMKNSLSPLPPPVPPLLSCDYDRMRQLLEEPQESILSISERCAINGQPLTTNSVRLGPWIAISNVRKLETVQVPLNEEVKLCFTSLQERLASYNISYQQIAFINILISDMKNFKAINETYKTYFGTSPPSRACVAVDLPSGSNVQLDCIAYVEETSQDREALHVQGLSYWAPANIGPYSQAIRIHNRIYVSGQIGLKPSHLDLPNSQDFGLEAALSLQHAHRILRALKESRGTKWSLAYQSIILWTVDAMVVSRLRRLRDAFEIFTSVPTLYVGAKSLPKGAQIETQVVGHTGMYNFVDSDDGTIEVKQCDLPEFEDGTYSSESCEIHWEISSYRETDAFSAVLAIQGDTSHGMHVLSKTVDYRRIWDNSYSLRLFHSIPLTYEVDTIMSYFPLDRAPAITCIPSRFLSTLKLDQADLALVFVGGTDK